MLRNFKSPSPKSDILIGIVIAFISIPISMGYAQIAGMPVIYGLYGSVLPIIIYSFITSSPQFVFGVDAAPCAIVGGLLANLSIAAFSRQAVQLVPLITLSAALWLLVFYLAKAGDYVNYISDSVMGGFITGIGVTIIMMQIPKLFGGTSTHGEFIRLAFHIAAQAKIHFSTFSFVLGVLSVFLIQFSKRVNPKIPMSVIVMVAGGVMGLLFDMEKYGVTLLPHVQGGFLRPAVPSFPLLEKYYYYVIVYGFVIAVVIFSETLLATNSIANRKGYLIDNNREVLAYSAGNFIAAAFGCPPINGSVSRSNIADQYGVKSQLMSLSAGVTMILILLFGTPLIEYLPASVLCAIVIAALLNILEIDMAFKLYRTDKFEFLVFLFAFLGVIFFGTIYGVVIGVLLSFIMVVVRASNPPMYEKGCIPGQYGFYSLARTRNARRIKRVLMYNFSGPLFFANVDNFIRKLEREIRKDTRHVVIDSTGITSIDIAATGKIVSMYERFRERGIDFVLAGHPGTVNDQLRHYGGEVLIEEGAVKRTRTLALRDLGIEPPYELEIEPDYNLEQKVLSENDRIEQFEWAYGRDADEKMQQIASEIASQVIKEDHYDKEDVLRKEEEISRGHWSSLYETEILDMVETRLAAMDEGSFDFEKIEREIEERRHEVDERLKLVDPQALEKLNIRRIEIYEDFRKENPEAYSRLEDERRRLHHADDTYHLPRDPNYSSKKTDRKKIRRLIKRKNS